MHFLHEFDDPVIEDRLKRKREEFAELPVHDTVQGLILRLDDLCRGFAPVIEFIVPNQVIPVFLDLQIQEVEKWFRFDGLQDVLTVCVRIADF